MSTPANQHDEDHEWARWYLRRLFKNLTALFLVAQGEPPDWPARIDWDYASGDCICPTCGNEFIMHVEHPFAPYLNVLCDGRLVKL